MMRTAVFRLCGQPSVGPSGVLPQLKERIRSPISPPPARKSSGARVSGARVFVRTSGRETRPAATAGDGRRLTILVSAIGAVSLLFEFQRIPLGRALSLT